MNTANKLTLLRVVMIPVFMAALYVEFPFHMIVALTVFILASVTDFIDGYIARNFNQITDFGKFMDPLADKLLVTSAMLWFVEVGQMSAWVLLIVIAREFAVSGLRMVAAPKGVVIAAGWSGKDQDGVHHGLHLPDAAAHSRDFEHHLRGRDPGHHRVVGHRVFRQEQVGFLRSDVTAQCASMGVVLRTGPHLTLFLARVNIL